jgi:hypothetical protein
MPANAVIPTRNDPAGYRRRAANGAHTAKVKIHAPAFAARYEPDPLSSHRPAAGNRICNDPIANQAAASTASKLDTRGPGAPFEPVATGPSSKLTQ